MAKTERGKKEVDHVNFSSSLGSNIDAMSILDCNIPGEFSVNDRVRVCSLPTTRRRSQILDY